MTTLAEALASPPPVDKVEVSAKYGSIFPSHLSISFEENESGVFSCIPTERCVLSAGIARNNVNLDP